MHLPRAGKPQAGKERDQRENERGREAIESERAFMRELYRPRGNLRPASAAIFGWCSSDPASAGDAQPILAAELASRGPPSCIPYTSIHSRALLCRTLPSQTFACPAVLCPRRTPSLALPACPPLGDSQHHVQNTLFISRSSVPDISNGDCTVRAGSQALHTLANSRRESKLKATSRRPSPRATAPICSLAVPPPSSREMGHIQGQEWEIDACPGPRR